MNTLPHQNDKRPGRTDETRMLSAIREVLNGNPQAFSKIVKQYNRLFYSLAYRMLGSEHEAEDAVQDIFFKVFLSLKNFSPDKRFFPWIYTIALYHLRSLIRKNKRYMQTRIAFIEKNPPIFLPNVNENDPSVKFIHKEGEALAQKALLNLKANYREVFVLREIEGLSVKQVAKILGKPEGTVKTYLHRAKKILIEVLTERI